jgi:hypothetical protein
MRRCQAPSRKRSCCENRCQLRLERLENRQLPSTVFNLNDAGPGSLRQAIADTPSEGTVDFDPDLAGTIALTTEELLIAEDLTGYSAPRSRCHGHCVKFCPASRGAVPQQWSNGVVQRRARKPAGPSSRHGLGLRKRVGFGDRRFVWQSHVHFSLGGRRRGPTPRPRNDFIYPAQAGP